jgi:hypothetical protein
MSSVLSLVGACTLTTTAIIKFNSILYYFCAESTAARPITEQYSNYIKDNTT